MRKTCVFDEEGNLINIGEWNDMDGANPLPFGATTEERDVEWNDDRGWYLVGSERPKTENELLREENAQLNLSIIEIWESIIPLLPE